MADKEKLHDLTEVPEGTRKEIEEEVREEIKDGLSIQAGRVSSPRS